MSKQEIQATPISEMLDLISCLAVYNGIEKEKEKPLSMEEVFKLR